MIKATFSELRDTGLISVEGDDAVAFLHAQLTSDVAGLAVSRTQYSGYCSPKGRLLASVLVWRLPERLFLQLPLELSDSIRTRLTKYVLRAKAKLVDAKPGWTLFGASGVEAEALRAFFGGYPIAPHDVAVAADIAIAGISAGRFLILASAERASEVRAALQEIARDEADNVWPLLDIQAGIPWIVQATQDAVIPQMVNLDLIGAVSFTKGCYPGQEIVARTHYLGRVKQRMYRIHIPAGAAPAPGDPLYGPHFGADQASGTLVNAAPNAEGGHDALAVLYTAALRTGNLRWKSLDGPAIELRSLPYSLPSDGAADA